MIPRTHRHASRRASVLVIVMWVAFGLVSIALYFAHSMQLELRGADNRVEPNHHRLASGGDLVPSRSPMAHLIGDQLMRGRHHGLQFLEGGCHR